MYQKQYLGFSVLPVITVIVVLGLIGALGYIFATHQPATKQEEQKTAKPIESSLTKDAVIEKVRETLSKDYVMVDNNVNNQPKEGELSYYTSDTSAYWKPKNVSYYVQYSGKTAGSIGFMTHDSLDYSAPMPTPETKKVRQVIEQSVTSLGLVRLEQRKAPEDGFVPGSITDVYQGKGLVCTAEAPNSLNTNNIDLSCGVKEAFEKAAQDNRPVVAALPDASSFLKNNGAFAAFTIADSKTSGYKIAKGGVGNIYGVGGAVSLLWQKQGGEWHFFKTTQSVLGCSEFTTPDLKAAFAGEKCFESADSESTVHI